MNNSTNDKPSHLDVIQRLGSVIHFRNAQIGF